MKYYLIAGEASGDLHGALLMKELKKKDPEAAFRFWGGDLMKAEGGSLVKHYKELAFMGFVEVLSNIKAILKNIRLCKEDIDVFQPDAIIYIDYPGFNFRIMKWAKIKGYRNHYYISPQIWAWKEGRIKAIKRDVDQMYVILPFEKDFYEQKHQFPVHFVGHPLIDAIAQRKTVDHIKFLATYHLDERPLIALLPGSRKQEIKKMLSVMLDMVDRYPDYQFIIAGAPGQDESFYSSYLKDYPVTLVMNRTYDLMSLCHAALVTSGTATLETALFKVPQVVCYKGSSISYHIAKRIVKLDYISLVNLIMDQPVVTELIQSAFNKKTLRKELDLILHPTQRNRIFADYYELETKLGGTGASENTASLIFTDIKNLQQ
ncbi:lipid-A-disaccharide synthase [Nonlabens sp.]|uniref:lipid-A-disaccharide synthase n=1 Tax=Nonlabens sp. TaxID=1888209 RepID=UPI001BCCBFAE|nr:lipid-A-disaccharide synthase [Nonlabens sp.]